MHLTALMDEDAISEQGNKGSVNNDEEILKFPGYKRDAMDLDMDPGMSDFVVPDVAVPDLESYATVNVMKVGV